MADRTVTPQGQESPMDAMDHLRGVEAKRSGMKKAAASEAAATPKLNDIC